jgi:hypothetical protein
MRRAVLAVAAVVALLIAFVVLPAQSAQVLTAQQVPTCVKPTGNPSHAQQVTYAECLQKRTEALLANAHAPAPTATVTVTETVTATPTPTPPPTEPSPTPTPTPEPEPETPGVFPTRTSVGPAVEPTRPYAGCYVDTSQNGTVIDGVVVDCATEGIRVVGGVTNVTFRNSILRGGIIYLGNDEDVTGRAPALIIEDSRIIQSSTQNWQDRAICCAHYVVKRSLIQGTHSGLLAHNNVTLVGNYITTDGTHDHQSGLRALKNSTLRGNTIVCSPVLNSAGETVDPDGGCSAAAVFYRERINGSPEPMFNMTIEGNYFKRHPKGGAYYATRFAGCNTHTDCTGVKFTGNVFDRGWGTDAGEFPFYGGNVWSGNTWIDGTPALSDQ